MSCEAYVLINFPCVSTYSAVVEIIKGFTRRIGRAPLYKVSIIVNYKDISFRLQDTVMLVEQKDGESQWPHSLTGEWLTATNSSVKRESALMGVCVLIERGKVGWKEPAGPDLVS